MCENVVCSDGVVLEIPKCIEKYSQLVKNYKKVEEETQFWSFEENIDLNKLEIRKQEELQTNDGQNIQN